RPEGQGPQDHHPAPPWGTAEKRTGRPPVRAPYLHVAPALVGSERRVQSRSSSQRARAIDLGPVPQPDCGKGEILPPGGTPSPGESARRVLLQQCGTPDKQVAPLLRHLPQALFAVSGPLSGYRGNRRLS